MAAQRMQIVDLSVIPATGETFPFTLNCAYWKLRVFRPDPSMFLNSTPLTLLVTDPGVGNGILELDFPPIFDGHGNPVNWNQVLNFRNATGAPIVGSLILVYLDPDRPVDR